MQLSTVLLLLVVAACGITDVWKQKIYNLVTYPSIVSGLLLGFLEGGKTGLTEHAKGFLVGFILMLIVHILGGMGAGDVKLMGAIGSLGGYPFIINALFFSVMVGGIISLAVVIWQKKLLISLKNVLLALVTPMIPGMKTIPLDPANSTSIPFGFAICLGTLWAMIEEMVGIFT
jgi:prepilin peptidase CpaA